MSQQTPIRLIVGLGNPGSEYQYTRHNAGAWFVQLLATRQESELKLQTKFKSQLGRLTPGSDCRLMIPTTFMNLSGQALKAVATFYNIEPQAILVAHDDLDFPVGTVKLKQSGGHGGHNGLRDIINQLGTKEFLRLRIGIGHPGNKHQVEKYVLNKPAKMDYEKIIDSVQNASDIVPDLLQGNIEQATHYLHNQE